MAWEEHRRRSKQRREAIRRADEATAKARKAKEASDKATRKYQDAKKKESETCGVIALTVIGIATWVAGSGWL